jgi:hypothetical protein
MWSIEVNINSTIGNERKIKAICQVDIGGYQIDINAYKQDNQPEETTARKTYHGNLARVEIKIKLKSHFGIANQNDE